MGHLVEIVDKRPSDGEFSGNADCAAVFYHRRAHLWIDERRICIQWGYLPPGCAIHDVGQRSEYLAGCRDISVLRAAVYCVRGNEQPGRRVRPGHAVRGTRGCGRADEWMAVG